MTENGGVEIREYEAGLFSYVLSNIHDVSFYIERCHHLIKDIQFAIISGNRLKFLTINH
jgi:hypothetical protein